VKHKLGFIKRVDKGRITTVKDLEIKADVSSLSPSSERIEELLSIVSLYRRVAELCHWWKYGDMNL